MAYAGYLPRFTYDTGPSVNLDFVIIPEVQETFTKSTRLEAWAPEADTGSTTEFIVNHIYMFDYVRIKAQAVTDTQLEGFDSWWAVVRDRQEFTYYPDKDTAGTNSTVIIAMDSFKPTRKQGLWYFDILLRVIS